MARVEPSGDAPAGIDALEEVEDALVDGDRPFVPGSARAAFSHPNFRRVYLGSMASNVGTWMQNVVLGALAYSLTGSAVFVGLVTFAQLGPLLLLSPVGGMLADAIDRKKLLITFSVQQALGSFVLALVVIGDSPSKVALVGVTFFIGIGNALYAPVFSAVAPILVPRRDLTGAVALNSVQLNASRVVGPAIGSFIYAGWGPSWVFVINGLSFAAVIGVLLVSYLPKPTATGSQGLHRLLEGFQVARRDRVVGQCLATIFLFSLLSLPFITQLPKIAGDHLGMDPKSTAYGLLYAAFGVGAVAGALSVGTVFTTRSKPRLTRICLVLFAVVLTIFGALRSAALAYPTVLVLGTVYFVVVTSLSTMLQEDLDDAVRGKVLALWIMGFGGTVPFGGLAGGWLIEQTSIELVLAAGGVVAVALATAFDFRSVRPKRPVIASAPSTG